MENGEPTGYMEENAYLAYLQKLPVPTMEELEKNFQKAQEIYASYGITTAQDGMVVGMLADIYRYLCSNKKLWLDMLIFGKRKRSLRSCRHIWMATRIISGWEGTKFF